MYRAVMILNPVNQSLGMFHPNPDRKWLGLDEDIFPVKQLEDITGGMTGCQNHGIRRYFSCSFHPNTIYPAAFHHQIRDPGFKMDFSAMRQDGFPNGFYHARKSIGSDMRMGIDQNIFRSPMRNQQRQNVADVPPLMGAGVELAVRIGPCAALSKTIIGMRVYNASGVKLLNVLTAGGNVFSPFQNDRANALLQKRQGGKISRRASPDDHHPMVRR